MNSRKWIIVALMNMVIAILFSIIFFITQNSTFTMIEWFFTMCELFCIIQLIRSIRKEDNAANDI